MIPKEMIEAALAEIFAEAERTPIAETVDDPMAYFAAWIANVVRHAMSAALTAALSRLTVSPLPEEIAEIVYHLRVPGWIPDEEKEKAAAALERMARAYEVLKNDCAECFAQNEQYAARIRELEAERDLMEEIGVKHATLKHEALERIRELEAERDAIKAKTIEDLAQRAFVAGCGKPGCTECIGGWLAAEFRALMPAGDGKEKA